MSRQPQSDPAAADPVPWIVEVAFAGGVRIPAPDATGSDTTGTPAADAAELVEWLWMRLGDAGLVGIDEGSVDVGEAAAAGLTAGPVVIDVAAAPADRDWVAARPRSLIGLAFVDERAARAAEPVLAEVGGLDVAPPRPVVATAAVPQEPLRVPGFGWVLPPDGAVDTAAGSAAAAEAAPLDAAAGGVAGPDARIVIDAGVGFGTGLHPTTRLCLRAIAGRVAAGGRIDRVLDVGAGSGILAIAAAVLGGSAVDAIEIDGAVHAAIRRNAALNGVSPRLRVAATLGELGPPCGGYDLVVANIVAPVLAELADALAGHVVPGGLLVLSGLLEGETPAIADRYARLLPGRPTVTAEGDWRCLSFTR